MKLLVRKVALTLAVVSCAALSHAQQADSAPKYNFVVWFQDGGKVSFSMDEHPVMIYADGDIVVTTSQEQLTYAHDEIRKFTLSNEEIFHEGGTTNLADDNREVQWQRKGDVIFFSDCTPGELVTIYNATAQQVAQYPISVDGTLQVPMSLFVEGMYIVKTESITYKFIKK